MSQSGVDAKNLIRAQPCCIVPWMRIDTLAVDEVDLTVPTSENP